MDLQSISRLENCITLVTLEFGFLNQGLLIGFQVSLRNWSRFGFLGQKFLPAPGIPFYGGGTCPLLLGRRYSSFTGVQGEREGVANGEGELEGLALAVQRLAEGHALGSQGGVTFTHKSHFCFLLLN